MLTEAEVLERYTAFRSDPANIRYNDNYFCTSNGVSVPRFRQILNDNPKTQESIDSREVTDGDLFTLLGLLTRLCYEKAFQDKVPVKSLEGLANALVALMKQRAVESGRPTEIIKIKDEELKAMTPQARYTMLMDFVRRPSN